MISFSKLNVDALANLHLENCGKRVYGWTCVSCVGVQMVQTFSRCILSSSDEVDLDELLATKLVTFMMDNQEVVLQVPTGLQKSVEEHVSQLRRVQVKGS